MSILKIRASVKNLRKRPVQASKTQAKHPKRYTISRSLQQNRNKQQTSRQGLFYKRYHRRPPVMVSKYRQNQNIQQRNQKMEALQTTQVPVPTLMKNIFVISIRADRASRMMRRLGNWRTYTRLLWGTKWSTINVKKWIAAGKVIRSMRFKNRRKPLTRGELGCYDSHVRVWKEIVQHQLPYALVLEDDAEISLIQAKRMEEISKTLQQRQDWDVVILYPINHVHQANPFAVDSTIKTQFLPIRHMTGLAGYLISLAGAKKLLRKPFPIQGPVDAYVPAMSQTGQLKLFLATPPLGNQINRGDSDTRK